MRARLATCVGLFLFTRILIPDVDPDPDHYARALGVSARAGRRGDAPAAVGCCVALASASGLLLKGLIAIVFPVGGGVSLPVGHAAFVTRDLAAPASVSGLADAARSPRPGTCSRRCAIRRISISRCTASPAYRGFFWFYFFNEHVLRFLNLRYPRDYNTVPRRCSGCSTSPGSFPGACSSCAPSVRYRGTDRASRMRLLASAGSAW